MCSQTTLFQFITPKSLMSFSNDIKDYWRNKDPVLPMDALIWFTDGSRTDLGTGSDVCGLKPNKSCSFSLGKFASVFQTEIYAMLLCAYKI
jgi:hypothetical protein